MKNPPAMYVGDPISESIDELVVTVIEVSGKEIHVQHVDGPVGVSDSGRHSRAGGRMANLDHTSGA